MSALAVVMIGESWHGSMSTGLARGFRAAGHAVELIGWDTFFPDVGRSVAARGLRRALTPFFRATFNRRVLRAVRGARPDLVVVYKGTGVAPATLAQIRRLGPWLCHVMPDTTARQSLLDRRIFSYFDHLFTTKSFGVADFGERLGTASVSFLPHGYDPAVHRPLALDPRRCAGAASRPVSFIGQWSPGKERTLAHLAAAVGPQILQVWGEGWQRVSARALRPSLRGEPLYGDFYAAAVKEARINLGLLIERQPGGVSGDLTTSRTFEIPACGGFLLHERTAELADCYEEGLEVACFGSPAELVEKVRYYLDHESERVRIAQAGYRRCVREHSLAARAQVVIEKFLAARAAAAGPPPGRHA